MRFAVISDTHYYASNRTPDKAWWNRTLRSRTLEIGPCMVDTIARLNVDFVIHCGDISGYCDLENFETARKTLDRLNCPWYGVLGNHDSWFAGVRDAFSDHFDLPHGQCHYTRLLGGLRFIFLDTCHWRAADGSVSPYLDQQLFDAGQIEGLCVPDHEIEWLDRQLQQHQNEKVVLVSHAPLGFQEFYQAGTLPSGDPAPKFGCTYLDFNRACGRIGDIFNRQELRALITRHPHVKAALAGHCHINDYCLQGGIAFIQTGSMLEYPFECRIIEIDDDTAVVSTHGLDNPAFAADSYLPDRNNRWVAGTQAERTFSFSL